MTARPMPDLHELQMLDAKQIKKLVGDYSDNALDRLVAQGLFPAPIKISRKRLWFVAEIAAWQVQAVAARNAALEAKRAALAAEERECAERDRRGRTRNT